MKHVLDDTLAALNPPDAAPPLCPHVPYAATGPCEKYHGPLPDAAAPLTLSAEEESDLRRVITADSYATNDFYQDKAQRLLATLDAARAEHAALREAHQMALDANRGLKAQLDAALTRIAELEGEVATARQNYEGIATAKSLTQKAFLNVCDERDHLRARVEELERQVSPEVRAAAVLVTEAASKHPDACCAKCAEGLAERDVLRDALATVEQTRTEAIESARELIATRDTAGRLVVAALASLVNEVAATTASPGALAELRLVAGNTNVAYLVKRFTEARAALAHVATTVPGWKET